MFYCQIAIDAPLKTTFTYTSEERLVIGQRVVVPFRRQKRVGIVLDCAPQAPESKTANGQILTPEKIKKILQVLDATPFVNVDYVNWLQAAADYYYAPVGQVLAQAIPSFFWEVDAEKRERVRKAKKLIFPDWQSRTDVVLTSEQNAIVRTILQNQKNFFPTLLQGVTGSGKTEVYIEVIREVLKQNKSALYLVPEIGLTPQTLGRLKAYFQDQLLVYHSGLSENQRALQWQACQSDKPQVLVGTRSAVFAPFANLGVIVVDEEHDTSYKQDDRFRYHARDIALMRAQKLKIPIVMGSATPSLETYFLAKQKKYHHCILRDRVSGSALPQMDVLDVGRERQQTGSVLSLSKHIHRQIDKTVERGQQVIVFVGKRGFAQNAFCVDCQKAEECPNCSVGLKHHAPKNLLKCHYCDFEKNFDEICPSCKAKSMTLIGMGIQAIENEIGEQHPGLRFLRVDSDAFPSPQKLAEVFVKFQNHEWDLIVGTQMMTKGHDFAKVGFVAVAGVESQLGLPDFRAGERAFQTVVQVAGRSGRDQERGLVLVQSYMPEHPSLRCAMTQDFEAFADVELTNREALFYPPYSRMLQLRLIGNTEERLKEFLKQHRLLFSRLQKDFKKQNIQMLGPAEMPIYKLRGLYRYHVIFKMPKALKPTPVLDYVMGLLQPQKQTGIDFQVDVDPQSLI